MPHHMLLRWSPALRPILIAAALLGVVQPARAQTLSGVVVESEVLVPIAAASVVLLDAELNVVASARASEDGRFSIRVSGAGPWTLQAEISGRFSSLFSVPDPGSAAADSLLLVIPSPLVDLAASCPASGSNPVLVGTVYDAESGVPVPSVRVTATWAGLMEPVVATTDRAGRYRMCSVPADADVALRVAALGRETVSSFRVPDAGFVRADIALELGTGASQLRVVGRTPLLDSASAEITGRVRSTDAAEPVTGIAVRVSGRDGAVTTSDDGRFRLTGVQAGDVVLEIEHIAFGTQREVVPVSRGNRTEVEITLAPRPIALRAIEVVGNAEARRTVRASPSRVAVFSGVRLAQAEARGATVTDLIRELAGVRVMEGMFTTRNGIVNGVCITTTRAIASFNAPAGRPDAPWCDPLPVVVDGVRVPDPVDFLRRLSVGDFESVQLLGAMEAQILYGTAGGGAGGAILLWTRGRGPYTSGDRNRR